MPKKVNFQKLGGPEENLNFFEKLISKTGRSKNFIFCKYFFYRGNGEVIEQRNINENIYFVKNIFVNN